MISERTLPAVPESVAAARQFIVDTLADLPRGTLDALELMISELATNSVVHAGTDFRLTVRRGVDEVRVEVTDSGAGEAEVQHPDAQAVHGRGLLLVSSLASAWGVTRAAGRAGKTVWLSLKLPRA